MFDRYFRKFLTSSNINFFFALVLINAVVFILNNQFILTKELYYNSFIERLSAERIDQIVEQGRKLNFISLLFIPIVLLVKSSFTTICIFIGLIFKGFRTTYQEIFSIALKAELVFVLANVIKIFALLFFKKVDGLEDLNYYPLSLINITGTDDLYKWLVYPLQTLNLFELGYWLLLAKGLEITCSKDFSNMLILVLSTYMLGLLIWIMIVMLFIMGIT